MITFDTSKYENSHGRKPSGNGTWIFAPRGHEDRADLWVTRTATYADARRSVKSLGSKYQSAWTVLP